LLYSSVMKLLLIAAMLAGVVAKTNTIGIIGVRTGLNNTISLVHPGSPCERYLRRGDRIVAIDGQRSKTDTKGVPGSTITLTIKRGATEFTIKVHRIAVQDLHDKSLNKYFGLDDSDTIVEDATT
jgi:C-terminal processing protease CtpA/Prc